MTTMTATKAGARTKPPFRADHVGSFLRPAALKDARAKHERGAITDAQLKEIENREVEIVELDHGIQFQGVQTKPRSIKVNGKIGFSDHPMLEHFKFLKSVCKVTPKMTIPSPTVLHFRLEPGAVSKSAYPHRDAIFHDLGAAYAKAVRAFYDAGCRYLQFD